MKKMYSYLFMLIFLVFILACAFYFILKSSKETVVSEDSAAAFPLEKPSNKIVEENWAFNSWVDEGFSSLFGDYGHSRLADKFSLVELRKLKTNMLKEDGVLKSTMQNGRTVKNLDLAIKALEEATEDKDNIYLQVFQEVFSPLLTKTCEQVQNFLTDDTVYGGLEADVKPDIMLSNWFRYGHLFAYQPQKGGALFTKAYRNKIYGNQFTEPMEGIDIKSIYDILHKLFTTYYLGGLRYTKSDKETFELIRLRYKPNITQKDSITRVLEIKGGGTIIVWKLEDNAWRLEDVKYQTKSIESHD